MTLPNITSTEISPVTVEMKHGLLKTLFSVSGNRVTLSDLGLETIVSEDGCPFEGDVTLEFTLESALLGSNIVELSIPIKLDSGSFDFAGFVIEEEQEEEKKNDTISIVAELDIEPLTVS